MRTISSRGLPYLDKIIYQNVQDKTAKRIGLRQNQFQLARTDSVMRFSDIKEFSKLEHLSLEEYKGIAGWAPLSWNSTIVRNL